MLAVTIYDKPIALGGAHFGSADEVRISMRWTSVPSVQKPVIDVCAGKGFTVRSAATGGAGCQANSIVRVCLACRSSATQPPEAQVIDRGG